MPDGEIELRMRLTAKQAALLLSCVKDRADEAVSYLRITGHPRPTAWEELAKLVSAAVIEAVEGDGRQGTFRIERD